MRKFPKQALLLAAGLGERLRPLTLSTPKPLIRVGSKSLVEHNLDLLHKFGIQEVVLNLFHLGEKIQKKLGNGSRYGLKISYSPEKILMGTGGGLKLAEKHFSETFLMLNADVLIDADLKALYHQHESHQALATLLVSSSQREDVKRRVQMEASGKITSIIESEQGYVFTGLQILEPEIFHYLSVQEPSSIVDAAYLPALSEGKILAGQVHPGYFHDVGSFDRLEEVRQLF